MAAGVFSLQTDEHVWTSNKDFHCLIAGSTLTNVFFLINFFRNAFSTEKCETHKNNTMKRSRPQCYVIVILNAVVYLSRDV